MDDGLIAAAWRLVHAQGRMLDRWAEADDAVKRSLWRDLHDAGDHLRDLLEGRPCHGCGRQMTDQMWSQAPATPGKPWERDCPDCANVPAGSR